MRVPQLQKICFKFRWKKIKTLVTIRVLIKLINPPQSLKKILMIMISGEVVKMIVTDPAAHLDFGVYTNQSGHQIIEVTKQEGKQIFYIKKK